MKTITKFLSSKSTSGSCGLDKNDFLKGLFCAIVAAFLSALQTSWAAKGFSIDLSAMGHLALSTGVAYLLKNLITDNTAVTTQKAMAQSLDGTGTNDGPPPIGNPAQPN